MGLFGLFGGKSDDKKGPGNVREIAWSKNASGKFRRLPFIELAKENLSGVAAVYVVWHGGVKPSWVYVGKADDLAMDITDMKQNPDIMEFDMRGGLYVTWAGFAPNQAPGVFSFLTDVLQPEVRNPEAEAYKNKDHIKVLPPGYKMDAFVQMIK